MESKFIRTFKSGQIFHSFRFYKSQQRVVITFIDLNNKIQVTPLVFNKVHSVSDFDDIYYLLKIFS